MESRWMLRTNSLDAKKLAKEAGISELVVTLLLNREIKTIEAMQKFIRSSIEDMYPPFLMKDMEKAIHMVQEAIVENKKILIYGDYDVDGVTSTTILFKALKRCGAGVSYHVPHRENEGYGLNSDRIREIKEEGFDLILTCDNGISALEQVALAKELGMTVIITDHHEVPFVEEDGIRKPVVPEADVIVNPKQEDCTYPFKLLCGAGIALKFAEALYKEMGIPHEEALAFIEIAAIGTICDVVDLLDENRIIAKNGLQMLNQTKNLGLQALIEETGLTDKKIGVYHIGFIIGPCINATGRLDTARLSVELLLSENVEEAKSLAKKLHQLNVERQELTIHSVEQITLMIDSSDLKNDKVFVIYNEEIHESIAGIVAGRIKERYYTPTLILTKGKDMPKGSGRSIEGYNMFEELIKCKELLDHFGGHPMAAGLSIEEKNISLLRKKLNENCTLTEEERIPKIRIDKRIPLQGLSFKMIDELESLEPFGKGNSTPVFAEKNIPVKHLSIIGKDGNTLKLSCGFPNSPYAVEAIAFGGVTQLQELLQEQYGDEWESILHNPAGLKLDLIFYPQINEFRGDRKLQLRISDMRLSTT